MKLILPLLATLAFSCAPECISNTCWGASAKECMQCSTGYVWKNNFCTKINQRTIPGYHRGCVECGISNYNQGDGTCKACYYPATECDEERDYSCKEELGFLINEITERCECITGVFHNGKCICQIENHFVDANFNCLECNFTTRNERGCDPDCPSHYYDIGSDCKPCHYSCDQCEGLTEQSCNGCAYPFEYVPDAGLCLCPCNSYQHEEECVCIKGYVMVKGKCEEIKECGANQYFNGSTSECNCVDQTKIIVKGECMFEFRGCPDGFDLIDGQCVAPPSIKCVSPFVLNADNMCDCPATQILYNGQCIDINCPKNALIVNKACTCPQGMKVKNWECVFLTEGECPSEGMNLVNEECVCPSGTINNFVQGACLPAIAENCPYKNQIIFNGMCDCPPLYFLRGDECVLMVEENCPKNMRIDYSMLQCVCKSGYILSVSETCEPCSTGTIYANGACFINPYNFCPEGSILNSYGVCVTQVINICAPGMMIKDGYCVSV